MGSPSGIRVDARSTLLVRDEVSFVHEPARPPRARDPPYTLGPWPNILVGWRALPTERWTRATPRNSPCI